MSISLSAGRLSCRHLTTTVVLADGDSVSVVFGFGKDVPGPPVSAAPAH
jgi:hypothetical protein